MRFDWYQATIKENPIVLVETLKAALAPEGTIEEGRGRHNYHQSFAIRRADGDRVAVVLAGGPNGDPNATSSGPATDGFVQTVRDVWPDHRVTRFDSAEDLCQEGAWEAAETVCRAVARDLGVKGRAIVPDDPTEGRTYYLGAPSSDVRVRLYDKTAEARRHVAPEQHSTIPDNWARLEVQVRPRKDFKAMASKISPADVWGFSGWTSELAHRLLSLQVRRITMQAGREKDDDRAIRFLVDQYGSVLSRLCRDLGSWECVGLTLGAEIERKQAEKRRRS